MCLCQGGCPQEIEPKFLECRPICNFQNSGLRVAVDTGFQSPGNFAIVGDRHFLAHLIEYLLSDYLAFFIRKRKQIINMSTDKNPPPFRIPDLVNRIVIDKGCGAHFSQHSFKELLKTVGRLLAAVQRLIKLVHIPFHPWDLMTFGLFDPNVLFDGGIHESILDIPMFTSETGIRIVKS